jgi:hypothetical protein
MKRKYSRSPRLPEVRNISEGGPAYVSLNDEKGLEALNGAFEEYGLTRSSASRSLDFSDLDTNTSSRPGLTRRDYEQFRPDEAVPTTIKEIIRKSNIIYYRVGLIRNIIDLMSDFTCQGLRIVHRNKRIQNFLNNWWKRIGGLERSERIVSNLLRSGNVIIRRQTAKLTGKSKQQLYKSIGQAEIKIENLSLLSNEIPWKYIFYDPIIVDAIGGSLSSLVTKPQYGLQLPWKIKRIINHPKTTEEKEIIRQLPNEIKLAAGSSKHILLPAEKLRILHYKKDDWQIWAYPMIYAIMDDIVLLEKLKLADIAALDGAISNIRIFKLGNLEHKIVPTRAAAAKLSEVLENHTGAGTMDMVWGPDIELVESKTAVHQFLGEEKYKPTLNNIYAGLGIPPTLTGTFGAAGTTNNYISLKTLVQRLEYLRSILINFWEHELVLLQKALGFRFPGSLEFSWTSLGDEAAERALLIQLADRNLISDELLQHYFNNNPEMEHIRINREYQERDKGTKVPKSGPFYDPQFGLALKKVALQTGVLTPSEVGIRKDETYRELKKYPKESGEKTALEMRGQPISQKKKGEPQQGRPKNSKDTVQRKKKQFTPKTKAAIGIWIKEAQSSISECLNSIILAEFEKKNMRSLNASEYNQSELIKFGVLCNIEPLTILSQDVILAALEKSGLSVEIETTYNQWVQNISKQVNRTLTVEELHRVQGYLYTELQEKRYGDC